MRKYFNKDISWLSFNQRVLDEAIDTSLTIEERLRFLAIFSSNLDEFYKYKTHKYIKKSSDEPVETYSLINKEIAHQQSQYFEILEKTVFTELQEIGVYFLDETNLTGINLTDIDNCKNIAEDYFDNNLRSQLHPIMLNKSNIRNLFLKDNTIYLLVLIRKKKKIVREIMP